MADIETIKDIALKTGLGLKFISKDEKISILLGEVSKLFEEAVLKGGTAMGRLYLGNKRFSEDIDMDFVGKGTFMEKKDMILARIEKIEKFDIARPRRMGDVIRFDCYYTNEFGERDKVRLEFNLSYSKVPAIKSVQKQVINFGFYPTNAFALNVYSFEDLLAQKIFALYERTSGKDIFDVYHALDLDYDRNAMKRSLEKISEKRFDVLKKELIKKLEDTTPKNKIIANATNHYIPQRLRPNWEIFIKDAIDKIEKT